MKDNEVIEKLRKLALDIKESNGIEFWFEIFIHNAYQQFVKPLEEELKDLNWYKMWHKKFRKQIEDLTTELETYRPTKLSGNGQCQCSICGKVSWTDFGFSRYKGQTLCDKCLKEVYNSEYVL